MPKGTAIRAYTKYNCDKGKTVDKKYTDVSAAVMNPWIDKNLPNLFLIRQKEQLHVSKAAILFNKWTDDTLMWKELHLMPP